MGLDRAMAENTRKPNDHSRAVSAQIRAERAAAGKTREQVWTAAGLTRSTYARIEKGTHVVDTAELGSIAGALGLTASELLVLAEQRQEADLRKGLSGSEAAAFDEADRRTSTEDPTPEHGQDQERGTGS